MLMFMSQPSGEHWTSMVCIAELQGESHCSKKNIAVPLHFAKDHVDKPEDYWRKGLMDEWDQNINFGLKWETLFGEKAAFHSEL